MIRLFFFFFLELRLIIFFILFYFLIININKEDDRTKIVKRQHNMFIIIRSTSIEFLFLMFVLTIILLHCNLMRVNLNS
jgi:heme/copper-type cytochrome/quinol oxidase subunit 2